MLASKLVASIRPYFTPRVFSMAVLGFPYGMMYFLAIPTLQVWLKEVGVSNTLIGYFAMLCIPYTLKFLWAPLIGYIKIPILGRFLGHRRSWLVMAHLLLIMTLILIGFSSPATHLLYTALLALSLTFFAGIQDIVIDAYRIEILDKSQSGPGVSMLISGYRLGSLTAQAGVLSLAAHFNWTVAYCVMAALVMMGIIAAILNPEPILPRRPKGQFFRAYVLPPLQEFFQRKGCWYIVLFILIFRLGDSFINNMSNIFYLETGFTKIQIANVTKTFGMFPTLIGGLIGGALSVRINTFSALLLCGIAHTLSHVMFIFQAILGYNLEFLYSVILLENLTGGLTTAIFIVYLSQESNLKYTATQYAFFTSLWSGATFVSGIAGWLIDALNGNWPWFFTIAFLISVPGILLIFKIKRYPLANQGATHIPL